MGEFPSSAAERDDWILRRRTGRNALDPWRPHAFMVEAEAQPDGSTADVATLFLTNRECPYRCLMCDLWRNTLEEMVPDGAIAAQIRYALERLPPARQLKLYNAGSFFDRRAIPVSEYPEIARLSAPFERVIVESHPALVGERCTQFKEMLLGRLEVAMGLETVHPESLERLNKRMTLDQFTRASEFLAAEGIDLRVFILVGLPWMSESESLEWAERSLEFAFARGASACSLIPTRAGNGAMDALATSGTFMPPSLASLEAALEYGLEQDAGRVFADLWDIGKFAGCPACSEARIGRLAQMNATQAASAAIPCDRCGGSSR